MFDLLVKNGVVVGPVTSELRTIAVSDGKVAAILDPSENVSGHKVIDATGKLVLPGFVDAHVHLREPGFEYKEDFSSGTMAAAAGGVTTVMDMPTDDPWTASKEDFEKKRELIKNKAYVDVALQAAVGPKDGDIEILSSLGAISFEIFLAGGRPDFIVYDDDKLLGLMQRIKEVHGVAGITAGSPSITENLLKKTRESCRPDIHAFNKVRPPISEVLGVARACVIAAETGIRAHLRQISCNDSVQMLQRFSEHSQISSEVTPHNLLLTETDAARLGCFAAVIPPLRPETEVKLLREALRNKVIDIVATDHAPHTIEEKEKGKENIWLTAPGLPGLQTFCTSMIELEELGILSINDIVRTCSYQPAYLFGLYPRKGALLSGSDADLIIIDKATITEIRDEDQFSKSRFSPFSGREVKGAVTHVLLHGKSIAEKGKVIGQPSGIFLKPNS